MAPIDIPAIEQRARALRAAEIRRLEDVVSARLGVYACLVVGTLKAGLTAVGNALRPLFSWNPQRHC